MPARDVHHWIDRWERTGLVDTELAQQLHADASRAGAAPAVQADPVDRVLSVARDGVVEALGYVGAALTLGTVVVLFDVPDWAAPALATLLLVAALVAGIGAWVLTPTRTATTGRLAGVLGALAAACVAAGLDQAFGGAGGGVAPDTPGRDLVLALPALVVAGVLYARHRHLLTHLAAGVAAVATCAGIGDLAVGRGANLDAQDLATGLLLLALATGWVVGSERGVMRPAWVGTPAGGAVAYTGATVATSWSVWNGPEAAPVLACLGIASVATAVGVTTSRLRVTIVGVAGLLVTVPMTFTDVFGWTATATAGVLLPIGIAVTAWAVLSGRRPPAGP